MERLHYDPSTGIFTWLKPTKRITAGQRAGSKHASGYIQIKLDGRSYYAHRLAWLYMMGQWPERQIDHKNLRKDDNSWLNLRESREDQNMWNIGLSRHNRSGVKGVSFDQRRGAWRAQTRVSNVHHHVGYFDDVGDAAAALLAFRAEHHKEFARSTGWANGASPEGVRHD